MSSRGGNGARQLGHHFNNGFREIKVTECPAERTDLVHHCYYGSSCVDADNKHGLLDRFCDCSTADDLTAGLMCEFEATSICMEADHAKDVTDQFCVNKGKCISLVGAGESHPGCSCQGSIWEGQHCEFPHGVMLDDALDLFQQRKAEITNGERSVDFDRVNAGEIEGVPVFSSVGSLVATLAVINLIVFAVWRWRRSSQKEYDEDYQSLGLDSVACNTAKSTESRSHSPPEDVFLASRKKEGESDDGSSIMMSPGREAENCEGKDHVEVLDAEASRILEAQFKSCEETHNEEEDLIKLPDEDPTKELGFAQSYESDREDIDQRGGLQSGQITINSGKDPLSKLQHEAPTDELVDVVETATCDDEDVGVDNHGPTRSSNGVTSLDGESDNESDDGHYYV